VHVAVGTCCEGAEQAVHSRAHGGQGVVQVSFWIAVNDYCEREMQTGAALAAITMGARRCGTCVPSRTSF
jgi:hypothetical protein